MDADIFDDDVYSLSEMGHLWRVLHIQGSYHILFARRTDVETMPLCYGYSAGSGNLEGRWRSKCLDDLLCSDVCVVVRKKKSATIHTTKRMPEGNSCCGIESLMLSWDGEIGRPAVAAGWRGKYLTPEGQAPSLPALSVAKALLTKGRWMSSQKVLRQNVTSFHRVAGAPWLNGQVKLLTQGDGEIWETLPPTTQLRTAL